MVENRVGQESRDGRAEQQGRSEHLTVGLVELPVCYTKGGRTVRALGNRFSEAGCLVLTKSPHPSGTTFSLKITNPRTKVSLQVDGSVIQRKHFAARNEWGMVVRYLNLSEREKEDLREFLGTAPATPAGSKYLRSPVGQAILRYLNLRRLFE
jgi:hypothetical protein